MSRTITIDIFDPASVSAGIQGIQNHITDYRDKVQRKTNELRQQVAELLQRESQIGFTGTIASDTFLVRDTQAKTTSPDGPIMANVNVTIDPQSDYTLVIANGEDAVWVEFGAGVYHNGSVGSYPNPLGPTSTPVMAAIGTYGHGQGAKNVWGYLGGDGKFHMTHGTPAAMPMYKAIQSVARDLVKIAQGVFSS